jgi:aryl-alcohol dehydrogenase-like predicted oxidoreductase
VDHPTGWWGNYTEGEALALMRKAFDLGITLFDAADTYGNGLSEEYIARAFPKNRDEIVIATKVGYDFVTHGAARGRGQREIPQDFSPDAILRATEAALKRLKTDRIDLLQLHNIRMEQMDDDALWQTLEQLQRAGKVRSYGIALGPAIGWMYEGINAIRERGPTSVQHIYNLLEQHPGRALHETAREMNKDTMFLIRVPHSSGMLEGKYTADTVFPPGDHRAHRPRSWLLNGVKKIDQLRFLESADRTTRSGCAAMVAGRRSRRFDAAKHLQREQLLEFAKAPETPALTSDDMERIAELYSDNFGIEEDPPKFKGTMNCGNCCRLIYRAVLRRWRSFRKALTRQSAVCGYFGRMLDKIRLHARGELHSDYHRNLGHPQAADGALCNFLRVNYKDLRQRVLEAGPTKKVLRMVFTRSRTAERGDIFCLE